MTYLGRSMKSLLALIDTAIGWVTAALVALMLVVIVAQAANRYFDLLVFNAFDQVARVAMVWVAFIALIAVFARGTNVRVDLLDQSFGSRLCYLRSLFGDLLGAAVMTVIHVKSWPLLEIGADMPVTGTPMTLAWSYMALTVGSLGLGLFFLGRAALSVRRARVETSRAMLENGTE